MLVKTKNYKASQKEATFGLQPPHHPPILCGKYNWKKRKNKINIEKINEMDFLGVKSLIIC